MTAFADLLSIQRACSTLDLDTALSRALFSTARPTIWFRHSDPVADAAVATGASKVGGEPDLPPGKAWPTRPALADPDGTAEKLRASFADRADNETAAPCIDFLINHLAQEMPMSFLAQVDLGAMSREPGFDPVLPDRGMLWAFNDPFANWYSAQSPSGGVCLLWDDAGRLERRTTPSLLREAWQKGISDYGFPKDEPWEAGIESEPLLPISGWTVSGRLNRHAYLDLQDERFEMKEGGGDQLGGWEQPVQQVMHGEIELIARGTGDVRWDRSNDLLSTGERWRHVLTINGETYLERLMTTWGDGAMFMFVDEGDLEARRFDKAAGTSQST